MAIFKSNPIIKNIDGNEFTTSDYVIVSNDFYTTNGENVIVTKGVNECKILIDSSKSDHIIIKSLTKTIIISDILIDEEFEEIDLDVGSCIELKKMGNFLYILSSDGIKND